MSMHPRGVIKKSKRSPLRPIAWLALAVAVPYALFVASLSSEFYNMTSPPDWSVHVALRKLYSVGAFALVGYLIARALRECGRPLAGRTVAILGAVYSGAIEIAQYLEGSHEGMWWNLFDVACGALGGAIAARVPGVRGPIERVAAPPGRLERSRARSARARRAP